MSERRRLWGRACAALVACALAAMSTAAAGAAAEAGSPRGASALWDGSLAIEGSPNEAEELGAARQARYDSSEAFVARQESERAYEALDPEASARLVREQFPGAVDRPDGGLPSLPEGERVGKLLSTHSAQILLPTAGGGDGGHAVLESLGPIAVSEGGGLEPIRLGLEERGGAFAPQHGLLQVALPDHIDDGIKLPEAEISLTPLAEGGGRASATAGSIDGDAVFWGSASMGTAVDVLGKPTTSGFDLLVDLRAQDSPETLRFEVGMPEGATLVQAAGDAAAVRDAGQTLASVQAPSAVDAEGNPVPTSLSIAGNVLTLTVPHPAGRFRAPILVDPEVKTAVEERRKGEIFHNWSFEQAPGGGYSYNEKDTLWGNEAPGSEGLGMHHEGSFPADDWALVTMHTNGDSKIYDVEVHDEIWTVVKADYGETTPLGWLAGWVEILKLGEGAESHRTTLAEPTWDEASSSGAVCVESGCPDSAGAAGNAAKFEINTAMSSEKYGSDGLGSYTFEGELDSAWVHISEPAGSHASDAYAGGAEIDKAQNVAGTGNWFGPHAGAFEYEAKDAGLGVSAAHVEVEESGTWKTAWTKSYLDTASCEGVECGPAQKEVLTWQSLSSGLPNGVDRVRVSAEDPTNNSSSAEYGEGVATIDVDKTPPHGITITGIPSKGDEYELGELTTQVKISATDGEGAVESSGVESVELAVDEHKVGRANGSCRPGPCTATGEWSINGGELGAGYHTLELVATDYAGNKTVESFPMVVYSASPVALGPGSVNPESGDFALESTDVSMSGGMGGLSVTRHYDSLDPTEGKGGPLGPQWTIGLNSGSSLEELPDGSIMLLGPDGLAHFAKKEGGAFEPPPGDGNLTLEAKTGEFLLKNGKEGTTTRFTKPEGAEEWLPTVSEGPVSTDTTTDSYRTVEVTEGEKKKIVEPTLEVAPHPEAICTSEKLERGCRALTFNYAETTTAKGEAPSEWGDYKGNLTRVYFHAWEPATKTMKTVTVAHYLYDKQGRLRAAWNPATEPTHGTESCAEDPLAKGCLATIYGYDLEGHVTAISQAGRQPWVMSYGTTAGDLRTGRVIKVMRPKATSALWSGEQLALAHSPSLSGTAVVGVRMTVSNGEWTGAPAAYNYQWEDCNYEGKGCAPIAGATNANYTPVSSDIGHTLVALVTATNGGGSLQASSTASAVVALKAGF